MIYIQWATVVLIGVTVGLICWMVWTSSKAESQDQPDHMDDEEMAAAWRELAAPPWRDGSD